MRVIRQSILSIGLLLMCADTHAQLRPLADYLPQEIIESLREQGEVRSTIGDRSSPHLIPNVLDRSAILEDVMALGSGFGVEILTAYDEPDGMLENEADRTRLYNILRSISSLEGVQYYSASRGRMRTLIEESYAIDDPSECVRQKDPLVAEVPPESEIYICQHDTTFGRNVYTARYQYSGESFLMRVENLTPLRFFFFFSVQPERFRSFVLVVPYEDGLIIYGLTCLETSVLPGLRNRLGESLYNRIKAYQDWFTGALSGQP